MYRFKRNATQARLDILQTPWDYTGDFANVEQSAFNQISPQIQTTTAHQDTGNLMFRMTADSSLGQSATVAFGIPFAINHRQDIHHYQLSGQLIGDGGNGIISFPFISRHESPLVANNAQVTNTTTQFKMLRTESPFGDSGKIMGNYNETFMVDITDDTKWDTGNVIIGIALLNTSSGGQGVKFNIDLSIDKYVEDLNTYDPSRS